MDAIRMSEEKIKPKFKDDGVYIPKSSLLENNISKESMWASIDGLVERFGCRGRGDLLVRLAAGELEIVVPPRKRRP